MLFNSINFMIFFPLVVLFYFLIPQKVRYIWLLVASYYFYMCWNPKYAILILLSTAITWLGGICIGKTQKVFAKRCYLIASIASNFGILIFFKYTNFLIDNINEVFNAVGISMNIPSFDILLPVGISFYTFQAVGYVIDVYRGDTKEEKNFLRYALFLSFFPQLVAGPIERSKNLLKQMHTNHYFDGKRVTRGLLLMGWGFFQKVIIADRIAILVDGIYNNYTLHTGGEIILATVLFAFQIYCDFSGYSDIAIGAAQVMGFELMKNFDSPYFSCTVTEFWRKWHISLTTWFRDYIYIPLGGNRCGKWKKYRNILVTFGLSGLWHGASWSFVVWGALNGLYQVVGDMTKGVRQNLLKKIKINEANVIYKLLQGVVTFILVDFAWLFFRANSFRAAIDMIVHTFKNLGMKAVSFSNLAIDKKDFLVLMIALMILALIDYWKKKVDLREKLLKQNIVMRWAAYYMIIFVLLIFGVYGPQYNASMFIYFQF